MCNRYRQENTFNIEMAIGQPSLCFKITHCTFNSLWLCSINIWWHIVVRSCPSISLASDYYPLFSCLFSAFFLGCVCLCVCVTGLSWHVGNADPASICKFDLQKLLLNIDCLKKAMTEESVSLSLTHRLCCWASDVCVCLSSYPWYYSCRIFTTNNPTQTVPARCYELRVAS